MKIKKLAIFVEGQTEQIFLREFIEHVAGDGNITFDCRTSGKLIQLSQRAPTEDERNFVLIYDCRGDEAVKSMVLDQRESLIKAGYSMILGLRDLYPHTLADLPKVKAGLKYGVPTAGIPTHILLAVAEIEAWFLQEHTHFAKIDPTLDVTRFKADFGFDPSTECAETVGAPAALLHTVYATAGKAYKKTRAHVQRTVKVLDYAHLYIGCVSLMPHLAEFVFHLENFLAPDLS